MGAVYRSRATRRRTISLRRYQPAIPNPAAASAATPPTTMATINPSGVEEEGDAGVVSPDAEKGPATTPTVREARTRGGCAVVTTSTRCNPISMPVGRVLVKTAWAMVPTEASPASTVASPPRGCPSRRNCTSALPGTLAARVTVNAISPPADTGGGAKEKAVADSPWAGGSTALGG